MRLEVQILPDKQIAVRCKLIVRSSEYRFALLASLQADSFMNNGKAVETNIVEECRLQFRPRMKKYSFFALQPGELTFCYFGALKGIFLFMQDTLCHFSFYNAWYPMGFDADERYDVVLLHDDSRSLLNGAYDQVSSCWRYCTEKQAFSDCNILLYDPQQCTCIENDIVRMLFFDEQLRVMATMFSGEYASIVKFYEKLYDRSPGVRHTIVFLPQDKNCPGAYIRENLIVLGETYPDIRRVIHVLAHELGHAYAGGADAETWEDWLNETHAEWSALLYTQDSAPELFEILIRELQEQTGKDASLKPDGESRPKNVHTTGTLLYYRIYQQYGRGAIEMLLRTFDCLTVKSTAFFLQILEENAADIAAIIRAACK